jgi:hypothetical protein
MEAGTRVYVSNISEERASRDRDIRYYVCKAPNGNHHYCVSGSLQNEASFLESAAGSTEVRITCWAYVVPCPEEPVKEMTLKEIQEKLGYKIKIVG